MQKKKAYFLRCSETRAEEIGVSGDVELFGPSSAGKTGKQGKGRIRGTAGGFARGATQSARVNGMDGFERLT